VFDEGIVDATIAVVAAFFFTTTQMKMTTIKIKNAPPARPPANAPVFAFEVTVVPLLLDEV
jgi:hypothetical protein